MFRYILAALCLFLGFLPVPSFAAEPDYSSCFNNAVKGSDETYTPVCPSRQDAYQQALAACNSSAPAQYRPCSIHYVWEQGKGVRVRDTSNGNTHWRFWLSENCSPGTEWFESLQRCDKSCSSRNSDLPPEENRSIRWATYDGSSCSNAIAECKYSRIGQQQQKTVYRSVNGQQPTSTVLYGGIWGYTGERCSTSPPPANPDDPLHRPDQNNTPDCTPAGSGQTYCIKPNGDNCYTSSAGRSICWRPGEHGVKTDKDVIQERKAGDVPPSPPPNTTSDSTTKVVTDANGNQTTTTVNNYSTSDGSNAGTSDSGEPTDANGVPGTSGGDGKDKDKNDSTGGGSCDSPPVSSGDALLAQIARQAWETRCAIVNRDAAQDQSASDVAAQGDGLEGVHESDIYSDSGSLLDGINENLLGSSVSQCSFGVPLELMGRPIPIPPMFWDLARWIGFLTVALAYLWVARQLAG